MKEICGCGSNTLLSKPLKYSPDDRLGIYRRKAKLEAYKEKDLI
jgi:rRNA maturation protein Nop10